MALFDWSSQLPSSIPAEWRNTKGKNVRIAFIDTGVDVIGVPALKYLNKTGQKFNTGRPGFSPANLVGADQIPDSFSVNGHGTLYASLLAGRSDNQADRIDGIANAATFFLIKARNANGKKTTIRNLLDALELSANLNVDIAITGESVALSNLPFEQIPQSEIDRVMGLVKNKKILLFGALKNRDAGEDWLNIVSDNFPNAEPESNNIAMAPADIDAVRESIREQAIMCLVAGMSGKVHQPGGAAVDLVLSNSAAAPVAGAIAALCLSFLKSQNSPMLGHPDQILQLLSAKFASLDEATGDYPEPVLFKNF